MGSTAPGLKAPVSSAASPAPPVELNANSHSAADLSERQHPAPAENRPQPSVGEEILLFEIAGERHGLFMSQVREVVPAVSLTSVPRAPVCVQGVVNVRGTVVPVLDVRRWIGLPAKPLEVTDHLIVATSQGRLVALQADRALGIVRVDDEQMVRATDVVPGMESHGGFAKLSDRPINIHDLNTFLASAEFALPDQPGLSSALER